MTRCVAVLFGLLLILPAFIPETGFARRGNPASNSSARLQYYIVDSDDDHPRTPTPYWVDTIYNRNEWTRVTGFTNNDDGAATLSPATTWTFPIPAFNYNVPRGGVSTNGSIALQPNGQSNNLTNDVYAYSDPVTRLLPLNNSIDTFAVIAALWGDWELRTTGDSSKVFYRVTTDSAYISYYNLALKGTEGKIRATFQVVFTKDSAITIQYRSFDGTFAGRTAEEIIQRNVTIGVSGTLSIGTTYLHRGHYYATSSGSSAYAKDLHDGLAVRFIRSRDNHVSARSITFPSTEKQELAQNNFTFSGTVTNWADEDQMIYVRFEVRNLSQDKIITTKTDSVLAYGGFNASYDGPLYQGLPCGEYEVTMKVNVPKLGDDPWTHDNVIRRRFYVMSSISTFPFYEQFNDGLSGCYWANIGAEVKSARDVMYDPVSPRTGNDGALVLDRTDARGILYTNPFASDTLTSAPINIAGKSNVYLNFSYQRGLKGDPIKAGTQLTLKTGPESALFNGASVVEHADTLVVEGLLATGTKWGPSAASWQVLHTITGGIDLATRKVRIELPSTMVSDHFRMRFRLKTREHDLALVYPHDDNDSYVIDGIQLITIPSGKTELEITSVDLGASHYTRVPRDVRFLRPKVTINNNGRNAGLASYAVRMIITDQLNREVYHKSQSFAFPGSFGDTTISMLDWDIKGSQGGTFSIRTFLTENFAEMYRENDTNTFSRSLAIADAYGVDDGVPDTAGSLVRAPLEWYYDFLPLTDDSIRGVDLFFLEQQGPTSWQMEFRRENVLLGQRSFSVTPSVRGFTRATFTPLHLPSIDTVTIHVTQTTGLGIGGDGARGMIVQTNTTPSFTVLYPNVVNEFRRPPGDVPFFDTTAAINGGVLIPMMRLVFTGSAQYLPVDLIRFTGKRAEENVELAWRTAKEENSQGFTVERSFGEGWEFVASVPARNAYLGAEYFAQDRMAPTGELTYRLTESDLDGSTRVIGHVKIGAGEQTSLDLRIYPNPASNSIRLSLSGAMPESVVLRDALGREIKRVFGMSEIDVSELAQGLYFLHVEANGETFTRAVTIAR